MRINVMLRNLDPRWAATALVAVVLFLMAAVYGVVAFQYLRITPGEKAIWREAQSEVADLFWPSDRSFEPPEKPEILDPQTPIWFCFDPYRTGTERTGLFLSEELATAQFNVDQCEVRSSPEALEWMQLAESVRVGGERLDLIAEKRVFFETYGDEVRARAVEKAAQRQRDFRQELVEWSTIMGGFWLIPGVLIGYLIALWTRKSYSDPAIST